MKEDIKYYKKETERLKKEIARLKESLKREKHWFKKFIKYTDWANDIKNSQLKNSHRIIRTYKESDIKKYKEL